MYKIVIHKKVDKFIDSLENSFIIREKLGRLKDFKSKIKLNLDISKYQGSKDRFRVRIGEVRFIFQVLGQEIYIREANYRGRVY